MRTIYHTNSYSRTGDEHLKKFKESTRMLKSELERHLAKTPINKALTSDDPKMSKDGGKVSPWTCITEKTKIMIDTEVDDVDEDDIFTSLDAYFKTEDDTELYAELETVNMKGTSLDALREYLQYHVTKTEDVWSQRKQKD
ncbi:hypothetical protein ADUPG1_013240 [Aduncisulcus paluster]|uniref:Uncharacterized protein n=1 Tax=Aduncisulcus paluster TaxID=2918883 RepID=A0ABQ5K5V0_9EUKA|nr:hypothetical protein ADUPG1_013240 [Aduncisulcus paluster]